MAANVYYSVCPFGTGDIKTGSPTISISSGVATLSVAQTGNIGQGCRITYNGTSVCYISLVNSPTSFNVVTATGGTPGNVSGQEVNSIAHEYASLADAMAGYTDASHINNDSMVAADVIMNIAHYYDHADYTVDGSNHEYLDGTSDDTRYMRIYSPRGLDYNESILNNRHLGVWDNEKSIFEQGIYSSYSMSGRTTKCILEGLQVRNTYAAGIAVSIGTNNGLTIFKDCILRGDNGLFSDTGSALLLNCVVYADSLVAGSEGIYLQTGTTRIDLYNCVVYNFEDGIERDSGLGSAVNCVVFGCTDDFDNSNNILVIDHCASDDGDGTNAVDISPGATEADDWAAAFTDYANGDFSLKSGSPLIDAGIGPALDSNVPTTDIVGNPRSGNTCCIGAFEYVEEGGTYVDLAGAIAVTPQLSAALKKYVGMSGTAQITAAASSGMSPIRGISGVIGGEPDVAGSLRAMRGLSGDIAAGAGLDAAMRPVRGLAGTIDARAELQAYARIYRSLAGVIAAGAGLDGALSLSGVVELSGSIGASAHMGASLRVTLGLAGQVGAPADMAGSLRPFRGLSGAIEAVAGILGAATGVRGLEGSIGIPADLTGGLRAERNLSGAIAATADLSGRLRITLSFSGTIDALAELLAAISTFVPSTLGDPIDLKIESVTPQRTMISITIKRQILEV